MSKKSKVTVRVSETAIYNVRRISEYTGIPVATVLADLIALHEDELYRTRQQLFNAKFAHLQKTGQVETPA